MGSSSMRAKPVSFPDAVTHQKIHPNEYTNMYVDAVAKHHRLTEVRSGWKNQARADLLPSMG
jgi:hypothetical protein